MHIRIITIEVEAPDDIDTFELLHGIPHKATSCIETIPGVRVVNTVNQGVGHEQDQ